MQRRVAESQSSNHSVSQVRSIHTWISDVCSVSAHGCGDERRIDGCLVSCRIVDIDVCRDECSKENNIAYRQSVTQTAGNICLECAFQYNTSFDTVM